MRKLLFILFFLLRKDYTPHIAKGAVKKLDIKLERKLFQGLSPLGATPNRALFTGSGPSNGSLGIPIQTGKLPKL